MHLFEKIHLQFFAEGASAGDAGEGSQGDIGPVAAEQEETIESLGVPKDLAEKYRKRKAAKGEAPIQAESDGNAESVETAESDSAPEARMSWEQIMADPEYNKRMQETVSKRINAFAAKHKGLDALAPTLELLGERYGLDTSDLSKLDLDKLNEAVSSDRLYFEDKALELGVDTQTAMRIDRMEREEARRKKAEEQNAAEMRLRGHFESLQAQSAELQNVYPDFNLQRELENPAFVRMTSPEGGLSVEQAFYAVHYKELREAEASAVASRTREALANSIRSNRERPRENGSATATISAPNPKAMSKADREALKDRIRKAAARGEHLPIGG